MSTSDFIHYCMCHTMSVCILMVYIWHIFQPIPVEYLVAEAVDDGDIKASGSFRGAVHTPSASDC